MSDPAEVKAFLNRGRMLADGIPWPDLERAESAASDPETDWFDFWMARADRYAALGERTLGESHRTSAGELLWLASLTAHYAQYMWFHDRERREFGQRRKVDLFDRAASHLRPPGERIEIPFEGATIPGYLRLPAGGDGPVPCCVLIGGLEGTKEESHRFEDLCLERGLASFSFDGPGQGEMFFEVKLRPDFERYSSAVLDELESRPEIDSGRIGVLGRSLGGHYAPKSAACDDRFAACCAWGACFDLSDLDSMPARTRAGFLYATGIEDTAAARHPLLDSLDLAPVAERATCPILVVHGRHDVIFSLEQVDKFRRSMVNAELEVQVERDGDHRCHNMGHVVRPRMADWLADRLGGRP
ncbi:MAG: alpha/beta hydrolase [Solirubrobacterales bacterium]|nr:alpha/beta hydrolase [Solirubrobacterales bacterium]